jgi:hypothetical protein
MHILVSFCNLRAPGVPALGLLDPVTGTFRVLELPRELAGCGGLTGLAACERYVYAVEQPSGPARRDGRPGASALLTFDRRDLRLHSRYAFRSGGDVHSLCVRDGIAYAVSTGTDEVLELRLRDGRVVSEVTFWGPEPGGRREDVHHLNAIHCRDGELIVAGFGKKSDRHWSSARDGFITSIPGGEPLARGLDQPHSLAAVGTALAYCESRRMAVRILGDGRAQHLAGYTRGLCALGGSLFVATSVGRQLSRSTGAINNPADGGVLGGQCGVSRLSSATFEVEQTVDLGAQAQEIYDLLPVEGAEAWPAVGEIAWRDASIRELAAALDQRTAWAKQVTAALAQREAAVNNLQAPLGNADALRQEVRGLRESLQRQSAALDALGAEVEFLRTAAWWALGRWAPDFGKQLAYGQQVRRIRRLAAETLPAGATVLVAGKGDEGLLKLDGLRAWHFPQTLDGVYSGSNPASSLAAIAQLEALRLKGADFLLLPSTAYWWLDHYTAFKDHLRGRYREVVRQADTCLIVDLRELSLPARPAGQGAFEEVVSRCRDHLGCEPAILDWNTPLRLASACPRQTVFSPPAAGPDLPYLDQTIDLVVVPHDPSLIGEARRVAEAAVVTVAPAEGADADPVLAVEWRFDRPAEAGGLPIASVIVPCAADREQALRHLAALRRSLPGDFNGEVICTGWAAIDPEALRRHWGDAGPPLRLSQAREATGYSASCNAAANEAAGEILVFLKRLTVPLDGWLPALLEVFRTRPGAGAVGGKVLSADGRIEQAGGVVFSDGSTAGFGAGDYVVDYPLYEHLREVDYTSDCLLATPRALFQRFGGLDPSYHSPAYAHADYCFRARAQGAPASYQPECLAVPLPDTFLRAAPGSTPAGGDQELFQERWQQALEKQPSRRYWTDRGTWHALAARDDLDGGNGR